MNIAQTWLIPFDQDLRDFSMWTTTLLGEQELAEVNHYSTKVDRQLAQVSRAAGRLAASRFVQGGVAAESWVFERTDCGARRLSAPDRAVHIGVSDNESTLVICAAASGTPGIDIESWRPRANWNATAERFFARQENIALRALSVTDAETAFVLLWTAKEALSKALQMPMAEMLGMAVVGNDLIDVRHWLENGITCFAHEVRWFDLGTDVLGVCSASNSVFADPVTLTLADLKALSGTL